MNEKSNVFTIVSLLLPEHSLWFQKNAQHSKKQAFKYFYVLSNDEENQGVFVLFFFFVVFFWDILGQERLEENQRFLRLWPGLPNSIGCMCSSGAVEFALSLLSLGQHTPDTCLEWELCFSCIGPEGWCVVGVCGALEGDTGSMSASSSQCSGLHGHRHSGSSC